MRKKNALVVGIANASSISAAIAKELYLNGYTIIPTYINEKSLPHVKAVTDAWGVDRLYPFVVGNEPQFQEMVNDLARRGQRLDVFVHGIAFASEIRKELHEVSWASFRDSTRISAFSLVEMTAGLIKADLLNPGASILTISYRGSQTAVEGYNMMGPVKSILESLVRGLASELGGKSIRVNAVSPGPVMTRAASGIQDFTDLIDAARAASPLGRTAALDDIGRIAHEMIENPSINGTVFLVDCGESVSFSIKKAC